MKPIYSREEVSAIAKILGFKSYESFSGYLANDYDMFEVQGKGVEDNNREYVEVEKEKIKQKMTQLKADVGFDLSLPAEQQILKIISIVKRYNMDYLLEKFNGKIDKDIAERLVEYAYTHGNCSSLVETLFRVCPGPGCSPTMVKGENYGHQCVELNGKLYDITGVSTKEEMKQFVALEGNCPQEMVTIEGIQLGEGKHKLIDYIVTEDISADIKQKREQEEKQKKMKVSLGRRKSKTQEDQLGWEDDISIEEIDLSKPIVICLPGSATSAAKSANGMCKSVESMLGISGLSEEEKPCNIYGLHYDQNLRGVGTRKYFDEKANGGNPKIEDLPIQVQQSIRGIEDFAQQIVDNVFKPMVEDENGKLRKPMDMARGFRNVHFVSFCFGSVVQSAINQQLREYLQTTELDMESIEKLESQICVLQAAPFAAETNTKQTTINFVSIADEEVQTRPVEAKTVKDFIELEDKNIVGGVTASPKNNPTVFVKQFTAIEEDEEHFGDFYLNFFNNWGTGKDVSYEEKVGGILPLCTAICLRRAMQNSVSNTRTTQYVPLRTGDIAKPCAKYIDWANYNPQDIPESLLEIYNSQVDYKNINLIETLHK